MDITMPEMDGLEALKAIKAMDPNAQVAMLTAMGQQQIVIEAVKSARATSWSSRSSATACWPPSPSWWASGPPNPDALRRLSLPRRGRVRFEDYREISDHPSS